MQSPRNPWFCLAVAAFVLAILDHIAGGARGIATIGPSVAIAAQDVVCGDANYDGKIKSADALIALRAAVGSATCAPAVCDFNGDGKIAASDALAILRRAVGQSIDPECPPPPPPLTWDEGSWGEVSWT